jgi:GT2 family glycosyltransferase
LPDQLIVVDASASAKEYQAELLHKFSSLFAQPDNHYIISEQPGLTLQRNIGLKQIKTDIVCFLDDDAFISPDYVSKILEVFQQDQQGTIGGVNGVGTGQFDHRSQKYSRLFKNYIRHHYGWYVQRIHVPKSQTKLFEPLAPELRSLPLIHIDRLWGANMNYRTNLIYDQGFDENFKRYGLFEDVDMSVRVGKTHKLVCRLDAEVVHDDNLGKQTRPSDARYFLVSWLNSAYIIEKLFANSESRNSHRRLFNLVSLLSNTVPASLREKKFRTLGDRQLLTLAQQYIEAIQNCADRESLEVTFVRLQNEIYALAI